MSLFSGGNDTPPFLVWAILALFFGLAAICAFIAWSDQL